MYVLVVFNLYIVSLFIIFTITNWRARRGRDRMEVGFIIIYAISALRLWVLILITRGVLDINIMWQSLSVTYIRSVVFYGYSVFLDQYYYIAESGVKYHKPKPKPWPNNVVTHSCAVCSRDLLGHSCHSFL